MAEVSFLHFLDEEHENDVVIDDIVTLDTVSGDRKNQVSFVMDLFHDRVEQSHLMGSDDFVSESVNESTFGVIEENCEMGIHCFDLELGLGLGLGLGVDENSDLDGDVDGCNCGGFVVSDCGDEFFVSRREIMNGNGNQNHASSSRIGGLSVVGFDSYSDSDDEEGDGLLGIDVHSEDEEDYGVDVNDGDLSIPLHWDSFRLEDNEEGNNDFEWEEVDGRVVDEREVLTLVGDPDEEGSVSILPFSGPEEDGVGERGRGLGNLEWEVLLNVNNLDRNSEMDDTGPYLGDSDFYAAEYELMFGQFADVENTFLSRPPASKSVVEKLPSMVTTEEDVVNEKSLCAVCKEQIRVGEEGKQLPCSHIYHGDCIFPWLGIRNTCPVCRHELPTDDHDYEQRRIRRAARAP